MKVRAGKVVEAEDGGYYEFFSDERPHTIPELFDLMEKILNGDRMRRGLTSVVADFDPVCGFPTHVYVVETDVSGTAREYWVKDFSAQENGRFVRCGNAESSPQTR